MVRSDLKKLNISLKETHLLDVYSNTSNYLELGTISFDTLHRLLNYEMINLEDISYFPIQNLGFSKSSIKNEKLKSNIPFLYYQNINQKGHPLQVFLTHGLLRYKNLNNKEVFSPLILIPVNIYFENGKIFFQQISSPIENTVLIENLRREHRLNIANVENLDSLFAIEKYIVNFTKHSYLKFEFENYLTFATVVGQEAVINQNKFNLNKFHAHYLYENLYSDDNIIYYSKKYNINQRNALNQAIEGKSFVITGRIGTGKSTVLKDIAVNAIAEGSRVLYVSNMKETLDDVYDFFEKRQLHYYVTDFTKSFSSFHSEELVLPSPQKLSSATNFDDLLQNYKYISDYQEAMTGRILDYRFVDVINELILLEDKQKSKLDIDSLENIYKYEYLEILNAVKNIENTLKVMEDFKDSVWKDIPIINDVKYPNQVISLIHKVQSGFLELKNYKDTLQTKYGFKEIGNYAYFKNILHNFHGINVDEIPKSWYERRNYELAKSEYHKLKTLIFTLQELEYDLDIRFDNLEKFDIKKEIANLYGEFFTRDDLEKINRIIKDRLNIVVSLNKALVQIDIFNKSYSRLKKILNYDFELDKEVIDKIIGLAKIINETNINDKYIKNIIDGNYIEVLKKARSALDNYINYNSEQENLFNDLPIVMFGTLSETIKVYDDYNNNLKVKRSQKIAIEKLKVEDEIGYKNILEGIKRYHELEDLIKHEDNIFRELFDYHPDQVYIDDFIRVFEFIEGITNLKIKSKIIKFLKRNKEAEESKNKNYHKVFDYFYKSFEKINDYYEELIVYEFTNEKFEISDKISDIQKINSYIQKSFYANDLLYSLKKINTNEYITAEDYYYIDESYKKMDDIKNELATNKDFSYLFGNMYNKYKTDLGKISKVMQAFRLYIEIFENDDYVQNSLNSETYKQISEILSNVANTIDNLNEVFKLYFKIFKNSVSRFYYTDFSDNIEYLKELLNNKDDLINYLKITDNLQVFAKYGLYKLIEYVVYLQDPTTLTNDFQYTYLSTLKDIYLKKHPYLSNYKAFEASLRITTSFEDEIIAAVEDRIIKKIKRRSNNRLSVFGVKNLDYNAYIRRTSGMKHLFLTNTQVLNNFVDIKYFDLVLIDDAHLFDANEYSYALQAKQVVIAGEAQLQEAVANNLISRISLSKNIKFNYRYSIMPKNLKNYTTGLSAPIYRNYYDNYGIEVITKAVYKYVSDLYKVNRDCTINLYIGSLVKQRLAYDHICSLLLDEGFTENEIVNILSNKLNIVDLKQAYLIDAEYNILFLEDYYMYDEDYLVANMIDNVLLCKKRLVIYDNQEILSSLNGANFLMELSKIVSDKNVFWPTQNNTINVLINALEEHKLTCYAHDLCSFIIRSKSSIYGVSVYWDSSKTNYDVLNEFRDIHSIKGELMKKNIIVWTMELVEDFEGVVQRILAEVSDD